MELSHQNIVTNFWQGTETSGKKDGKFSLKFEILRKILLSLNFSLASGYIHMYVS